jgi:hypothetical protein
MELEGLRDVAPPLRPARAAGTFEFLAARTGHRMNSKRGTEVHRSKGATGSETTKNSRELKYRKIRRGEEHLGAGVGVLKRGIPGERGPGVGLQISSIRMAAGNTKNQKSIF